MYDLTADIQNYNKVKDIVLNKLVSEGLLDQGDAQEFSERCHVLVYKGNWFTNWFKKNVSSKEGDEKNYYIRIVELQEKEDDVDRLLRRTTGNYDE